MPEHNPGRPQQRADAVGGQQVPRLLLARVAATIRTDGHVCGRCDLTTQAWLLRLGIVHSPRAQPLAASFHLPQPETPVPEGNFLSPKLAKELRDCR